MWLSVLAKHFVTPAVVLPAPLSALCTFQFSYPYLTMESTPFQDLSSHKCDLSTHMYHHLPFTYILTLKAASVCKEIHQKSSPLFRGDVESEPALYFK